MIRIEYDENGKIKHNGEKYKAIKELDRKLTELDIPHEMHEMLDGYQICVPEQHELNCFEGDAIEHFGSYGSEQDLLEVYGFNLDDPDGHLTVEQALEYFVKWNTTHTKGEDDL